MTLQLNRIIQPNFDFDTQLSALKRGRGGVRRSDSCRGCQNIATALCKILTENVASGIQEQTLLTVYLKTAGTKRTACHGL